ncbi:MFS transporter [Brevibacillus daliensis]|uniref:MFS transporter n=1 Tax=Brevibacillus daliensis TaxID=2892995 RepID=UPI001E548FC8|nr:MFS transporter [Brevibacillus daliensis]
MLNNSSTSKPHQQSQSELPKEKLGKNFFLLWTGQTVSTFGNQITIIALPLVAISFLQASNFIVGMLSAISFLPNFIIGLQAGAYVDRKSKKTIMLFCQAISAVLLLLIPICAINEALTTWFLFVIAFITGCCTVFYQVAYTSYLPEIIEPKLLQSGNSKLEITKGAAQTAGPGLGGYLVNIFSAPMAIIIDALSFIISFILIIMLPKDTVKNIKRDNKSIWPDIYEGLTFTAKHQLLRAILISYSLSVIFIGLFQSISVLYMTRTLNLTATNIGLIIGLGNIGFLIGAIITKHLSIKIGIGKSIVFSLGLIAVGFLIIGFAPKSTSIPWLIFGQFVLSLGVPIYNINFVSLRQAITPRSLLGRVSSVSRFVGRGFVPIGAFMGAGLATVFDPRVAVIISGIGGILAILPACFSFVIRVKSIQDAQEYSNNYE